MFDGHGRKGEVVSLRLAEFFASQTAGHDMHVPASYIPQATDARLCELLQHDIETAHHTDHGALSSADERLVRLAEVMDTAVAPVSQSSGSTSTIAFVVQSALLKHDHLVVANVGDSRALLVRVDDDDDDHETVLGNTQAVGAKRTYRAAAVEPHLQPRGYARAVHEDVLALSHDHEVATNLDELGRVLRLRREQLATIPTGYSAALSLLEQLKHAANSDPEGRKSEPSGKKRAARRVLRSAEHGVRIMLREEAAVKDHWIVVTLEADHICASLEYSRLNFSIGRLGAAGSCERRSGLGTLRMSRSFGDAELKEVLHARLRGGSASTEDAMVLSTPQARPPLGPLSAGRQRPWPQRKCCRQGPVHRWLAPGRRGCTLYSVGPACRSRTSRRIGGIGTCWSWRRTACGSSAPTTWWQRR